MESLQEEVEIITQHSGADSQSSERSLSQSSGNERRKKIVQKELNSLSYVCPTYNFTGNCTSVGCKKRHIYIEEGLEELIKENLPLLDLLERQGVQLKVPEYENLLADYRTSNCHKIIKPQVIVNYTLEVNEKGKKTLVNKLRKDIDKMQDKLKTILYLKKWVTHNFVDAGDFNEIYYSLNPTQQTNVLNFFRVVELQIPQFQQS